MSSALGNAIFCDDDDFIGVFDCREAVCDCDRCSVFRKFFETFLYSPFAFIIKSAGSFVKNQDRRVLKEDTGNRNPLFFVLLRDGFRARLHKWNIRREVR